MHPSPAISDDETRKKQSTFSPSTIYFQLLLQHTDKQHLFSFAALIFTLTLYVLVVPLTQPRIIRFSSSSPSSSSSILINSDNNNNNNNNNLHNEKSTASFLDTISFFNQTLSHIFDEAMPKISERVDELRTERQQLEKEFSDAKTNSNKINNNNDGGDEKAKSKRKKVTVKDFQILLENELSQVQRDKDDAIGDKNNNKASTSDFLHDQQQQGLKQAGGGLALASPYQQQQQQQQQAGSVPESACMVGIGDGAGVVGVGARNGFAARQRNYLSAQMIENEAPQEAVSERPAGPYVAPVDLDLKKIESAEGDDDGNGRGKGGERVKYQREFVKKAFEHSWRGYHDFAWGMDELQPRTCNGKNWNEESGFVSLALSMIDGLTTMHVMGLHRELEEALQYIKKLSFNKQTTISTFETTIRVVGSLLSIYELRGEKEEWILRKAQDVADRLMFAFNTTTGLPHNTVDLFTHRHFSPDWSAGASVLSEFGTVQLELRTLSFHTRDPSYDMKATHVMDIVEARAPIDCLCPVYLSLVSANWLTDHITIGALGDSFYEYVVKQFLLTDRTEKRYQEMFRKIGDAVVDKLVFRSATNSWAYLAEWRRNEFYHKQDHLACFFGGNLALAAHKLLDPENNAEDAARKERWMKAAADLTETCYEMYHQQKSGVSPEYVEFLSAGGDFINGPGYYILRPETMESLFYLWRFTKDQKFRDFGWNIFKAIDRWCRVSSGGYSGLKEVNVKRPIKDNTQQSFWLAETLKYSYLLFCDDDVVDLDEWVFNTEAHPLRIRKRDPLDVWREWETRHDGKISWDPPIVQGVSEIQRTETENMKKRRLEGHYRMSAKDQYSEEVDAAGGIPDDEGLPFEPSRGMRGVPRVSRKNRAAWFGVQPQNILYQGQLPPGFQGMQNNNNANRFQYKSYNNYNYEQAQQNEKQKKQSQQQTVPPLQQQQQQDAAVPNENINAAPLRQSSFARKYRGAFQKARGGERK